MNNYCFALVGLIVGSIAANAQDSEKTSGSRTAGAGKGDPAATKLMNDTHSSWAHWKNFPGFTADLEVNLDGKISKGKVEVTSLGKVNVDLPPSTAQAFAETILASIAEHRLRQRRDVEAPAVFVDDNTTHPLGRAIRLLEGTPGMSFRVRGREYGEIDRRKGDVRYTHAILDNRPSQDGQHLTISYVGNMWDTKTGALRRSEATHQTWERVGKFDLPTAVTQITASADNKLEVGMLKLSNFKVNAAAAGK